MKPTKQNLNKIIKWTKSKYSVKRKNEVVNEIYDNIKLKKLGKLNYITTIADSHNPFLVIEYRLITTKDDGSKLEVEKYLRGEKYNSKLKIIKFD